MQQKALFMNTRLLKTFAMIKKTLFFSKPAHLHQQYKQLIIELKQEGTRHQVPIEDIGIVVLENQQITITQSVIASLLENNACVLWCDEKHMPSGLLLSMAHNHTYTEKVRFQLEASEPLKKNLWKQTVTAKIRNQASLLRQLGLEYKPLQLWSTEVSSGDKENIEAKAASFYWEKIFTYLNTRTTRHRHGPPPNNLLNYGYAILRAVIARNLVASGCLLMVGIYHRNKYNPYCLADDIMEPYRPFIDRLIIDFVSRLGQIPETLTPAHKKELLSIPAIDVIIDSQKSPLMVGSQRTTSSLVACFKGESKKILYPNLE